MLKEFRDFLLRGNIVELAVAFVMGVAFGAVINSLRFEYHDTGELPYLTKPARPCQGCDEDRPAPSGRASSTG